MAGNAVSVIAVSTQGKGGLQKESLPRSASRSFTISHRNVSFRCSQCNTILAGITYKELKARGLTCPFCGTSGTVVTVDTLKPIKANLSGTDSVYDKVRMPKSKQVLNRRFEVYRLYKDGLSQGEIANKLDVCLGTIVGDFNWLRANNYQVVFTRGRKPKTASV